MLVIRPTSARKTNIGERLWTMVYGLLFKKKPASKLTGYILPKKAMLT
jgi:hypothetical protein